MFDLIKRVMEKAEVDQQVAERTIDVVLTEVKQKLPPEMASKLVAVLAGQQSYSQSEKSLSGDNHNADQSSASDSDNGGSTWSRLKQAVSSGSLKDKINRLKKP